MAARLACVLLLVVPWVLAQRGSSSYDSCTTPDRRPGACVVLWSCPALYSLVQTGGRPLSSEVKLLLQRSHCGFEGNDPKVCCANTGAQPTTPPTRPSTVPTPSRPQNPAPQQQDIDVGERIKDATREPNVKLLPHDLCGPITADRIIGGNKTVVFEFPWMARLGYTSRDLSLETRMGEEDGAGLIDTRSGRGLSFRCGGSLINDRYVLTAAHCVVGLKSTEKLTTVRLGESDILSDVDCSFISGVKVCAPPVVDVRVEDTIAHPQFSVEGPSRLQNDVALVRLANRVKFTEAIKPICLPLGEEQERLLDGKKVTVAGWGTTETGFTSPDLLKVNVPVVRGPQCVDVYKTMMLRISPGRQICAGGSRDGDSCNGDSGGPLKYPGVSLNGESRIMQFGIVSFGPRKCGTEGMPGVYTRVGYYMQWILRNIRP